MNTWKRQMAIFGSGVALGTGGFGIGYEMGKADAAPYGKRGRQEQICAGYLAKTASFGLVPKPCLEPIFKTEDISPNSPEMSTLYDLPDRTTMEGQAYDDLALAKDRLAQEKLGAMWAFLALWGAGVALSSIEQSNKRRAQDLQ
jgi:hypothetical protein